MHVYPVQPQTEANYNFLCSFFQLIEVHRNFINDDK